MELNIHQQQGVNHLNRILNYAPFVAENGKATVHLTQEDWGVVADTLFQMQTPKELLPEAIESFQLANQNTTIELKTPDYLIEVDMF